MLMSPNLREPQWPSWCAKPLLHGPAPIGGELLGDVLGLVVALVCGEGDRGGNGDVEAHAAKTYDGRQHRNY
jgi:hypothetical protein